MPVRRTTTPIMPRSLANRARQAQRTTTPSVHRGASRFLIGWLPEAGTALLPSPWQRASKQDGGGRGLGVTGRAGGRGAAYGASSASPVLLSAHGGGRGEAGRGRPRGAAPFLSGALPSLKGGPRGARPAAAQLPSQGGG